MISFFFESVTLFYHQTVTSNILINFPKIKPVRYDDWFTSGGRAWSKFYWLKSYLYYVLFIVILLVDLNQVVENSIKLMIQLIIFPQFAYIFHLLDLLLLNWELYDMQFSLNLISRFIYEHFFTFNLIIYLIFSFNIIPGKDLFMYFRNSNVSFTSNQLLILQTFKQFYAIKI